MEFFSLARWCKLKRKMEEREVPCYVRLQKTLIVKKYNIFVHLEGTKFL